MTAAPVTTDARDIAADKAGQPGRPGFDIRLLPQDVSVPVQPEQKWVASTHRFEAGKPLEIRINAGTPMNEPGWTWTDGDGHVWWADRAFVEGGMWGALGGKVAERKPVSGALAADPASEIYRFERDAVCGYRFQLPPGEYELRLHFAEAAATKTGERVFDVRVNGAGFLRAFDPLQAAGAPDTPTVQSVPVKIGADGCLHIEFRGNTVHLPMINGLEILGRKPLEKAFVWETGRQLVDKKLAASSGDPGPALYRIDLGSHFPAGWKLKTGGNVWLPDAGWKDGAKYGAIEGGGVTHPGFVRYFGTASPGIYRSEHYGMEGYRFDVPPGTYTVRLHMVESFECVTGPGQRVFDVSAQGELRLKDVDPFARGGGIGGTRTVDIRGVKVAEGTLDLGFTAKAGSAALVGIEVFQGKSGAAEVAVWQGQALSRRTLARPETAAARRVLHIGNSHTFFWAMPETVASAVNAGQDKVWIESFRYLHGGWGLNNFFDPNQDPGDRVLEVIKAGRYDVVVLQDTMFAYLGWNDKMVVTRETWDAAMRNIRRVADACREAGSKLVLYAVDDPNNVPESADALAKDFQKFAREIGATVIPSAEAFQATDDPKWNGPRPDGFVTSNQDGVHFSIHRAFLNKCLFWIAWTGEPPAGRIPRTLVGFDMPVAPEIARWIEEFAWNYYADYARQRGIALGLTSFVSPQAPLAAPTN